MKNTPDLYDTVLETLSQLTEWQDKRHTQTMVWMIIGLLQSGWVNLSAWVPYICSRAVFAQSKVRRFSRWLHNENIEVNKLYGPIIQSALSEWGEHVLYLALDTSMLWHRYCLIRLSVIYRGRAVPLIWKVCEHKSSSVAFDKYKDLLEKASLWLPCCTDVEFLADRGFVNIQLMTYLNGLQWNWHIRVRANLNVYRSGKKDAHKARNIPVKRGRACFWHNVSITEERFGPVHLAVAKPAGSKEHWLIVSNKPTTMTSLNAYALRFDIEENFLDDKSNGFQLESSSIRSASALHRLCFLLAVTTLFLVAQGTDVVRQKKRRWVDPHWFRGASYLKIGWGWVLHFWQDSSQLITFWFLTGAPDPEPAMASRRQAQSRKLPPWETTVTKVFQPLPSS